MIRFQSVRNVSSTDRYYGICYDPSRQSARKWVALGTSDKSVARQRWAKLERKAELEGWDP